LVLDVGRLGKQARRIARRLPPPDVSPVVEQFATSLLATMVLVRCTVARRRHAGRVRAQDSRDDSWRSCAARWPCCPLRRA
jgi:hypothetical protein